MCGGDDKNIIVIMQLITTLARLVTCWFRIGVFSSVSYKEKVIVLQRKKKSKSVVGVNASLVYKKNICFQPLNG